VWHLIIITLYSSTHKNTYIFKMATLWSVIEI